MDSPADTVAAGSRRPLVLTILSATWSAARQVAWGVDAASRLRHGLTVPPDHGARRRPRVTRSECRPR